MKFPSLRLCVAFTLLLLGVSHVSFAANPEYGTPLDIGALSGGQHLSIANGINNSGLVCGLSETSDFSTHAFVYNPTTSALQDLGTLPGGSYSEAYAVNDAGQVAGDANTASGQDHLFLWDSANGMQDLGRPAGSSNLFVFGINASSQICGSFLLTPSMASSSHAFVYSGGTFHDLGVPSGYVSSQATGINASGTTCGYVADSLGNPVAFVHSGTAPLTSADLLPRIQNGVQTQANGINNAGQVVGSLTYANGETVGFVYSGGTTQIVSAGVLNGINNVGVAVGEVNSVASGFLYNIAAQATQAGPSVCDYPAALNDHNDSVGSQSTGQDYTYACLDATDIGALPGGSDSRGSAINALGQVVGRSRTSGSGTHVILHDGQGLHDINALLAATSPNSGPPPSRAFAINANGQIVGNTGNVQAFLYDAANGLQDIGTLEGTFGNSTAYGLNDSGQVVGVSDVTANAQHAFLYTAAGGMQDLGTLPGGTYSAARAVNNAGQIVGQSDRTGGQLHAFLYTAAGGMQDLGTLPGGTTSQASAVSASGQVAGFGDLTGGETHAFLYTAFGGMQDLGTLPGGTYSVANGINVQRQVVGYADNASGQQTAFLWDSAHGMRDLNTVMTSGTGFTLTDASALNDRGQITGYGVNALGQTHGFILTPIGHTHLLWNNTDSRVMLWSIAPDGSFTLNGFGPYTDGAPQNLWHATAVATGPDGVSHLLWNNTDGRVMLWTVDDSGNFTLAGYGPYTDDSVGSNPSLNKWSATAVSVGPDNVVHLLWNNTDHRVMLWNVAPDFTFTLAGFGPYTDTSVSNDPGNLWSATALATGPDNVSRIIWNNVDNRVMLWDVDSAFNFTLAGYGPYTDNAPQNLWSATGVSVGPDNVVHLLWSNTDRRAMFWNVDSSFGFTLAGFGPYTDDAPGNLWTATALATGPDGLSHLLWGNTDDRAMLWGVDNAFNFTVAGYGPYTDNAPGNLWSATAVSAGP